MAAAAADGGRLRRWARPALALTLLGALVLAGAACSEDTTPPPGVRALDVRGPGGSNLAVEQMGNGPVALVLAHGYGTNKSVWYPAMDDFSKAGYRAYTFDSRGVGESEGEMSGDVTDREADLAAVVKYARAHGARKVVVMGSSLGAEAALRLAGTENLAAVVGVSPATIPVGLDEVTEPVFFVASVGDRGPARIARQLGRHFDRPATIVEGSVHGADLFLDHQEAVDAVVAFLEQTVPPAA